jgi:hypothetical protein
LVRASKVATLGGSPDRRKDGKSIEDGFVVVDACRR